MAILVAGASGATGQLLVADLLSRGKPVRAVVRSPDRLSTAIRAHPLLSVWEANLLRLGDQELSRLVNGCDTIASCLGHSLTLSGIYGSPRKLVTDSIRRLCDAVQAFHPPKAVRFVLMNTAGNRNPDLDKPVSFNERCIFGFIRLLLPPHADNEKAADYLKMNFGSDEDKIEWAVVRPDTLVDENTISDYEVHPSPTRSAIFNPGRTSRINVAHFMADLITDAGLWGQWKGKMPVIYNKGFS